MSHTPPPGPPPSSPPPSGPPPAHPPTAEVLERGGGGPLPPSARRTGSGGGRRRFLWVGAGVAALGLAGGVAFGAWWYLATGPQPAEALPATTLGYAAVDLDPSGGQKLDALRTMKKFPALAEELELGGDVGDIDVAEKIVELAQREAECEGLDYEEDIEPWLGDRLAMAAVDTGGEEPVAVIAVQVSDGDAAEKGVATLDACGGGDAGGSEPTGAVVDGDWMLVAETQEIAEDVASATDEASLADDEDFQRWTGEAGEAGVVSLYAAPAAGELLAEELGGGVLGSELPDEELASGLEEFAGMAATVRFDDGSVEIEVAGDAAVTGSEALLGSDRGAEAMTTLPEDTVAALGVGFEDGWFARLLEDVAGTTGEDVDALLAEAEAATGMELPEDVETMLGDSAVLAVGSGLDVETMMRSGDPSGLPVALKVVGDAEEIEDVIEELRSTAGMTEGLLETESKDGTVVAALDEDYGDEVLEDGGLGDSERFRDVVPEADRASAVLYLDLDGLTTTISEAVESFAGMTSSYSSSLEGLDVEPEDEDAADEEAEEVKENLEPLAALGISSWTDGDVAHGLLRLTTD